jgi:hypothetical protein
VEAEQTMALFNASLEAHKAQIAAVNLGCLESGEEEMLLAIGVDCEGISRQKPLSLI